MDSGARPLFRLARSYAAQAEDHGWLSRAHSSWLLLTLAVGFFVRVYGLAAQSLWNDEGTSVTLAQTSWSAILNAAARDIHPPLYYLLLSGWIVPAGISEFAIRFLSVMAGVLVIAVTFRIAREFFDEEVALLAAILAALNPFQTYYAQETRMYIWVTLFAALSVWLMVRWLNPRRAPVSGRERALVVVGYALATLAALYTNYYAFTLILVENLGFVAWVVLARREQRPHIGRTFVGWFGVQAMIGLLFLPWVLFARASLTAWPGISEPMSLADMAWRVLTASVTGTDTLGEGQVLLVAAYALFFIGGLMPSRDLFKQSAWGILLCALWALVPLLAMYGVSLARPAYNPKFLLLATPGLLILVARGVSVLYPGLFLRERAPRWSGTGNPAQRAARQLVTLSKLFVGALFMAGILLALQSLSTDPRLQRDDYRGIIRYLNARTTPQDVVIVNAPGQMDVVRYYYRGQGALQALPIGRPVNRAATDAALDEILKNARNAYGIFWATEQSDPEGVVEGTLGQRGYEASDEWHGNVRLAQFALAAQLAGAKPTPSGVKFGDELRLDDYLIGEVTVSAGALVPLQFDWSVLNAPHSDYKIFVHLLDSAGRIVSQRDARVRNDAGALTELHAGDTFASHQGIWIQPATPPGDYTLVMGLYRAEDGARLALDAGGDTLTLGKLHVFKSATTPAEVGMSVSARADFGDVRALGYNLERTRFTPGQVVALVMYWQAREQSSRAQQLQVQLFDPSGALVTSSQASAAYPTNEWNKDEIVRDPQTLALPNDAIPGTYRIVLTDGTTQYTLTQIQVK